MSDGAKFWVGVVSREHVLRGVADGFAMVNHGKEAPLRRLAAGDGFIFYSPKTAYPEGDALKAFTALGRVGDTPPYQAEMRPGMMGWRRDIVWQADVRQRAIADIQHELAFAQGNWGLLARRGFFEISAADFDIIAQAMRGN